ncbi:MAG: [FeFe] hydrogenase H-cluster maturation GTPase HydF [Lachnospiraceae bacterium]|nr:[FeFe] hydrogenase H-cluster maturation GTPase HydF [Candidatus Equihabitans merdae]
MSLQNTPSSERPHIAFFGMRNAGKSSLVNAVTGQNLSIVSDKLGTTTDPVTKAMEILPLGPVVIIDTPGFDDQGDLGQLRVEKAKEVLRKTDVAILVADITKGLQDWDHTLISLFKERSLPYIIVLNKADLAHTSSSEASLENALEVSSVTGTGVHELKEKIGHILEENDAPKYIVRDLISKNDLVVLVIPIDESAPKGRIILPQQLVLRELLDANAAALCVQDTELPALLSSLSKKPALVITDSQAFKKVSADTPEDIPLTSFSILLARYKGFLEDAVNGTAALKTLSEGSRILIAEGCTHHRQCNDIGTVKLPKLIKKVTGKDFIYETCSGREYPSDLTKYDFVLHCGGCMLNEKEMLSRMKMAKDQGVPVSNYGITLAYLNGILKRSVEVFPGLAEKIE